MVSIRVAKPKELKVETANILCSNLPLHEEDLVASRATTRRVFEPINETQIDFTISESRLLDAFDTDVVRQGT